MLPTGRAKQLCLTLLYAHLGGIVKPSGSFILDVHVHVREAEHVYTRLRKALLNKGRGKGSPFFTGSAFRADMERSP